MKCEFSEEIERELLDFIQKNYGLEVFTPGLARTRPIYLSFIEIFQSSATKITIIAGTNGKGQTAQTLTHYLMSCKKKVAMWTSPHILSLRERFFINEEVSYDDLKREIYEGHQYLKTNHKELRISFYEFLFFVFLRLTIKEKIDHLILEVGLGGRLDAVNHFDADCMCITSISRDHQAILGNRLDLILMEKIGVARKNKPLFTQIKLEYLNQLTKSYCESKGIDWRPFKTKKNYFLENQEMALRLFKFLEPGLAIDENEEIPQFRGRREEMTFNGNTLIFIGAHNIDGVRRMIELFSTQETQLRPEHLLISFSKRPVVEIEIMLKSMNDFFGRFCKMSLTAFNHPKALEIDELVAAKNKFNKINKGLLDFVTDWKTELKHSRNQKILVCGSYYFVGEVQRFVLSLK